MERINRCIRTLYLATSNKRDEMLKSIIYNVLFLLKGDSLSLEEINDWVSEEFKLNINKYEMQETLDVLTNERKIKCEAGKYFLSDESIEVVRINQIKNNEQESKAIDKFKAIIAGENVDEKRFVTVFKEYIYSCFLDFGKDAISFLIGTKEREHNITLNKAISNFSSQNERLLFSKSINKFIDSISNSEISYFYNLADRSEKFFSLGIDKTEYEKFSEIEKLKLGEVVIYLDTNVLYSVLELRDHPENAACNELFKLIEKKALDISFKYFKETFNELKTAREDLERLIPDKNYIISEIKLLLSTGKLDTFSQAYYLQKLENIDTPHPKNKIKRATSILKYKNIEIDNRVFKNITDSQEFINKLYTEYLDFKNSIDAIRAEKGLNDLKPKTDRQIEHDVIIRESINTLRGNPKSFDEVKFYGLSLDNTLIKFDSYLSNHPEKRSDFPLPIFYKPSVFLNKIKPFLPLDLVDNDYKKAFITAISKNTYENTDTNKSIAVQNSLEYFKGLGIHDHDAIFQCIKEDVFLEKLDQGIKTNSVKEVIESELQRKIVELKSEKNEIAREKEKQKNEQDELIKNLSSDVEKLKEELRQERLDSSKVREQLSIEEDSKSNLEQRAEELSEQMNQRDKDLHDMKSKIESLNDNLQEQQKNEKLNKQIEEMYSSRIDGYVSRTLRLLFYTIIILALFGVSEGIDSNYAVQKLKSDEITLKIVKGLLLGFLSILMLVSTKLYDSNLWKFIFYNKKFKKEIHRDVENELKNKRE